MCDLTSPMLVRYFLNVLYLSIARKCIKSALFSVGVLVGLPRFFLDPTLHKISNNAGPCTSRSAITPADISSGVAA